MTPTTTHTPTTLAVPPAQDIAPDCRHYRGDKPCIHNRLCLGCTHYQPYATRLCIIKLGALGDVVRTLSILPALRKKYPEAHVTWVSLPSGCRMIAAHPLIDRVLNFDFAAAMILGQERFDLVICLDKEPEPCALAMSLFTRKRMGVGLGANGKPVPLNPEAGPYFNLGLSDDLKFHQNTKSYPRLIHEALALEYRGQPYDLPVDESAKGRLQQALARKGWKPGGLTLGVNVGAGKAFANKMWPPEYTAGVIRQVRQSRPEVNTLLLGGPEEQPSIDAILHDLRAHRSDPNVFDSGTHHDESSFVALVDLCDAILTGDTMALHVAVARRKHVVAFFGPTCAQEIDLFGRGVKLVASVPCGPCYKRRCDQADACVKEITEQQTADAVLDILAQLHVGAHALPLPQLAQKRAG